MTKCLWKKRISTTIGSVTEIEADEANGMFAATDGLADPPAAKREIATGSVQLDWVSTLTNRNSLYASSSVKSAVEMIPGHARGTITLRKAVNRLAPSIIADSSKSLGMSMKKLRSIQMVNG